MSDDLAKSCGVCKWFKQVSRLTGDCTFPIPDLPVSISVSRMLMYNGDTRHCQFWETRSPECA